MTRERITIPGVGPMPADQAAERFAAHYVMTVVAIEGDPATWRARSADAFSYGEACLMKAWLLEHGTTLGYSLAPVMGGPTRRSTA